MANITYLQAKSSAFSETWWNCFGSLKQSFSDAAPSKLAVLV